MIQHSGRNLIDFVTKAFINIVDISKVFSLLNIGYFSDILCKIV